MQIPRSGSQSFDIALLLNEVSEKKREMCNEVSEISFEIRPKVPNALLAGGEVFSQISQDFPIKSINFKSNFTPRLHNALLQAWRP